MFVPSFHIYDYAKLAVGRNGANSNRIIYRFCVVDCYFVFIVQQALEDRIHDLHPERYMFLSIDNFDYLLYET